VVANELSDTGLTELRTTQAEIVAGTVEDARFPDASFDLVVSLEVLEHLPDPSTHLRELARITRRGGLLLLTTPNFGGLSRRWLGMRWRVVDPGHIGYFNSRLLRSSLAAAGYSRLRVRARSLDVASWRRTATARPQEIVTFDPQASAQMRDAVQGRRMLRVARESLNKVLAATGLGDSLMAWAVK
jgi:2-polyprenyl-3-methyl-5-hydroxy-6-metoxy-1,4-benzoquinol methylase